MGTELSTDRLKQAGIVNFVSSLSPREASDHRAFIGVRVEALLEPYWDKRPSDLVKAEILMDWMDALQGFSPEEIRFGCREYLKGPDCRSKPKPGDIRRIIEADRAKRIAALPKPKAREDYVNKFDPAEVEQRKKAAAEIMAKFRGVAE